MRGRAMKKKSDVHVRVTTEEKALMVGCAREEGADFSTWVRDSLVAAARRKSGIDGSFTSQIDSHDVPTDEAADRRCARCKRVGAICCPRCEDEIGSGYGATRTRAGSAGATQVVPICAALQAGG